MFLGRHSGSPPRLSRATLAAMLGAVGLLAAACGASGSDQPDAGSGTFTAPDAAAAEGDGGPAGSDPSAVTGGSSDNGDGLAGSEANVAAGAPTSIAGLEAQWAERRAQVVRSIRNGGFGLDEDGVLTGPGGFELDLGDCPSGWSDTGGIGETVAIGYTIVRSGNLASYGAVADGMATYFDYVNAGGGVAGLPLELVVEDDEYRADRTVELVDGFLAEDRVFTVSTLGYPGTVAVMEKLNDACVPHPFAGTSHPVWGDPLGHPWTTGLQMAHSTEAVLWGNWIKANLVAELPVKVAALVRDDALGLAYESAFRAWAEANPDVVSEFVAVPHGTVPDTPVSSEMATIQASEPDVFISMTAGSFCLLAVQEAGRVEMAATVKVLFTPSVCRDPGAYMIPAGEVADDWHIVGGGIKATTDPRFADEPFIAFTNATLTEAGFEPAVGLYGTGFATYGWAYVEVLRIAAELDGGLTRSNVILAQRALDLDHPILLDGVRFSMEGAVDSFPVEGSNFGVFDAETQAWVEDSPVIDVDGSTPNCAWSDRNGC